jgi:hypothetical protein
LVYAPGLGPGGLHARGGSSPFIRIEEKSPKTSPNSSLNDHPDW